jgi:hypothetical protein
MGGRTGCHPASVSDIDSLCGKVSDKGKKQLLSSCIKKKENKYG